MNANNKLYRVILAIITTSIVLFPMEINAAIEPTVSIEYFNGGDSISQVSVGDFFDVEISVGNCEIITMAVPIHFNSDVIEIWKTDNSEKVTDGVKSQSMVSSGSSGLILGQVFDQSVDSNMQQIYWAGSMIYNASSYVYVNNAEGLVKTAAYRMSSRLVDEMQTIFTIRFKVIGNGDPDIRFANSNDEYNDGTCPNGAAFYNGSGEINYSLDTGVLSVNGAAISTPSPSPSPSPTTPPIIIPPYNPSEIVQTETIASLYFSTLLHNKLLEINTAPENNKPDRKIKISSTQNNITKFILNLNGESILELHENQLKLAVEMNNVEYIIPTDSTGFLNDFNLAKTPGMDYSDLTLTVHMSELSEQEAEGAMEYAVSSNMSFISYPVDVSVTVTAGGIVSGIEGNNAGELYKLIFRPTVFSNPIKSITGVIVNADGSYSHIPTIIKENYDGYSIELSTFANSRYMIVNNPITVSSVFGHWSENEVNELAARLVVENVSEFQPDEIITRGRFAEYITKALGIYRSEVAEKLFSDVDISDQFADAITVASKHEIINGYPDGTFRPSAQISREEAMLMFARAMDVIDLQEINNGRIDNYTDKDLVSEWAYDGVKKTISVGVFNGRTEDTIVPQGTFTHAEAVKAIHNLLIESDLID